jgi:putative ABC transport system substrate-binding protein
LQGIEEVAPTMGVQVTRASVRNAAEIEQAIHAFAQHPNGGLVISPSSMTLRHRDLIIDLAAKSRLPAVYPFPCAINSCF